MKGFVIYNPGAGQRDKSGEITQMVQLLHSRGWDLCGVEPTVGPGDATRLARQASDAGCDVVFTVGGDGTMSQALGGLVGTETALAVLPGGTGNVMARQLGLPIPSNLYPSALIDAARLLLDGTTMPVDVGEVRLAGGGIHYFLCWCGVGFDAQVNLAVEEVPERKQRLGKLAFIVAAALALRDVAGVRASLGLDGQEVARRVVMLVASNIQLYGVWLKMAPRAILDDGWLDIYCFEGKSVSRSLWQGMQLLVNRHLEDPEVDFYRVHRLDITCSQPLPVHADGESIGYTPLQMNTLRGALRLVIPPSAPADLFAAGADARDTAASWQWLQRQLEHPQGASTGKSRNR